MSNREGSSPTKPRPARPPAGERGTARVDDARLRAASDDTLLTLVRQRHLNAFGELYRRHRREAYRYARLLTYRYLRRDAADDLVAEAMRKVLAALANGRGPRHGFWPYLVTTLRSVAFRESTRAHDEPKVEHDDHLYEAAADDHVDGYVVVAALSSLPERVQRVLWLTEGMELPPIEVAARLGTEPSKVPMLAMRAREALRVAYVRQHLPSSREPACRRALDLLARRLVTALSSRQDRVLDGHLDECPACGHAAVEIDEELAHWSLSPAATARFRRLGDRPSSTGTQP